MYCNQSGIVDVCGTAWLLRQSIMNKSSVITVYAHYDSSAIVYMSGWS